MNASNKIALERATALQECISKLTKKGCDIIGVKMDDHSTTVLISPPKRKQLTGDAVRVSGGHNNQRNTMHQTRIERCTVRWIIQQ